MSPSSQSAVMMPSTSPKEGPPVTIVFPSPEMATEEPCPELEELLPDSSIPTGFQTPFDLVNTQTAPFPCPVSGAPTTAVFPSADRARENPKSSPASGETRDSFCWVHAPLLLVK